MYVHGSDGYPLYWRKLGSVKGFAESLQQDLLELVTIVVKAIVLDTLVFHIRNGLRSERFCKSLY